MRTADRERAIELRLKRQWGYGAIAKELGVAKSTLSRWLENLPLSEGRILELRRQAWTVGEAKRERFRQTMRAKRKAKEERIYRAQLRKFAKVSKQAAFVAGLMLYAAEGEKKSTSDISFTNTDPALVRFFSEWSMRFLKFPKEKFRIQLHLYTTMDIRAEESYWLGQLGFSREQLWQSQVRPLRPKSFFYRDASRHGICKLYAGSVPKKAQLMLSIRAFFDTYKGHTHA